MASNVQVGRYLARLREKAGFKQNELAHKVTWSPTVLSRVESGEREVSQEELVSILSAIGTEEAMKFVETKERNWTHLPEPTLGHPDEDLLWEAEETFGDLVELSKNPDIKNVFVRRLDEYQSALKSTATLVSGTEYTIAFIGDIGVGKSTVICRAANLEVQEPQKLEPVLESGGGGVTICDVHVTRGPHYGIRVEPVSESELRFEVNEFAHYLMRTVQAGYENVTVDQEARGTSWEIGRAIRNMSSLPSIRGRMDGGRRETVDHARNLAQQFMDDGQGADALTIEILSRIKLHQRIRRELWYPELSDKQPLVWLKDIFSQVNNGRNAEFSLPKRIDIIVPNALLEEGALSTRLVDTRGIDDIPEREDLESHFNESNTVVVLCSRFNNAPSTSVQLLLERAVQGQVQDLTKKAAVLVLPRPEEALAVKNDQGDPAQDTDDGYEMKGEQAETVLTNRGLDNAGIGFFNVREDPVERMNDFLLEKVGNLRKLHLQRLGQVIGEANALITNYEREQKSETLREAARRLRVWINVNNTVSPSALPVENSLTALINKAHPSSLWASIRREGEWHNLDYPYQLGRGGLVKASKSIFSKQQDFKSNVNSILDDPEMEEAHGLAQQAQRIFDAGIETLLRNSQQVGVTVHTDYMKPESDLWGRCEELWGQGRGYRDDVLGIHKKWFQDNRKSIEARIQSIINREWARILGQLSNILESE